MEVTPEKQEFYDTIAKARELPKDERTPMLKVIWANEAAEEKWVLVKVTYEPVETKGKQWQP